MRKTNWDSLLHCRQLGGALLTAHVMSAGFLWPEEQSYHTSTTLREDEGATRRRMRHLRVKSKPVKAQISRPSRPNSCCQGLLSVSPFTFFPSYQAERDPHPALHAERRLLLSGGAAVGEGWGGLGDEQLTSEGD